MTANRPDRPSADHASHDQLLIARAAADDELTAAEQATVAQRLSTCSDCATLHTDLLALTSGLRTDLPTPRRPRDFRLTPELAARPSWRERLGGAFLGRSWQPLAAAVCALGLFLAVTGAVMPRATGTGALGNEGSIITDAGAPAALPGQPLPQAVGGPAASAKSGGGSDSSQAGGAGPSAVGVDLGSLQPRPTLPVGAFGSVPSGGAGDVAPGSVPPTTERAASSGGVDATTVLMAGGLLLFVAGGGGLLLLRRRSP